MSRIASRRLSTAAVLFALAALLAGCGSLGRIDRSEGASRRIADYDRVVVGEFVNNDRRPAKDEESAAAQAAAVDVGRQAFADRIAEEIGKTGAFAEVSREPLAGPALRVAGSIEQWEPGNIAARSLLGFAGKSQFDATVVISDAQTGEELARIVVDRNSWPLPIGASTNLVQTVEFLMGQAAARVASELAAARGVAGSNP